ncbi:uncharacterized protein LOC120424322 [Culex pipiens pallens]|uniref:uncharacterized protein LOC120424322 n=1 Tax=Culex pipiens pallens TaxID=42434 RepID=UPI0022AB0D6F|nr:uncharacterized protein LOC120424322 [Culex pipiens pallens]
MSYDKHVQNVQLMAAVKAGVLQTVEELINAGADVNFVDKYDKNETPLHVAVNASNARLAELLLAKGANTEARNIDNEKPMDLCSRLEETKKQEIEAVFNSHFGIKTYIKRAGTGAVEQYYRTKLLAMVLFRLLHDDQIESFYLGNNLGEVGAFDDVVLRTCSQGRSRVYFLQAKHRDSTDRVNLSDLVNMQQTNGDFHLSKYFDSYLKIRYMFEQTSEHAIFQGKYEETELTMIIFTPAIVNYHNEVQCEIINSKDIFYSKTSGKIIKIMCTSDLLEPFIKISEEWHSNAELSNKFSKPQLPSHNDHANLVKDFFEKVRIHAEQATEAELAGIVQYDIRDKNYESEDMIFAKFHSSIENWWMQSGQVPFETKSCQLFNLAVNEVKLDKIQSVSFDKVGKYLLKFNVDSALYSKWDSSLSKMENNNIFFLNIFSSTPKLSCLKLIQYLELKGFDFKFVVIEQIEAKHIIDVLSKNLPKRMILVFLPLLNNSVIEQLRQTVCKLIVITSEECHKNCTTLADETRGLDDLDFECQEKILNSIVTFQSSEIPLRKLMDGVPSHLIDAQMLQRFVNGEEFVITNKFQSAFCKSKNAVQMLLDLGANANLGVTKNGFTALHWAAQNDMPEIIQLLIDKGANIDCITTDNGRTPLNQAAFCKSTNAVKMLLDLGANANLGRTSDGFTPLHWAAFKDSPEIIQLLIDKGANIDCITTDNGRTPLHEAVSFKSTNAVKMLLDLGANANLGKTSDGFTPLHWAAFKDSPEIIQLLIDKGANIDCITTDNGRTPLYQAALCKSTNAVKMLLDLGANANLGKTSNGFTPLHWAAHNDMPEIIQLLIDKGANIDCITTDNGRTPLHEAVSFKSTNAVKMLLDLGANANLGRTSDGFTPLHWAAHNDMPEIIQLLIDKGANIDCITTDDGRTPLCQAAFCKSTNAVKMLLDLGANANLGRTSDGFTPLHWAAFKDSPEIIQLLIDKGANIDCITTDNGRTPLSQAAMRKSTNAVKMLLDLGANANLGKTSNGFTPLHWAAYFNMPDIIQLLKDKGANIDCITTDDGRTPLYVAAAGGSANAVEKLLNLGANPGKCTNIGSTPLSIAVQKEHSYIEKMLQDYSSRKLTSFSRERRW